MGDYQPFVMLDLDGTLVDSVYLHVVAWSEAFRAAGHDVPDWRVHAAIGMGGDRLVPWLLGEQRDDLKALKDDHERRFLARTGALRPTVGDRELVEDLEAREIPFAVATSATADVRAALLDALGRTDLETTDADEVASPKPAPDLLLATCARLGADPAQSTLVGDSPWDAEAAERVGIRTIAVRCGGFGDDALVRAGAIDIVDDPRALIGRL